MTKKDKIGAVILIAILVILGLIFVLTTERSTGPRGDFTNNPIVERRINTLDSTR